MMDSIRRGQHDLDEKIGVTAADYVRQGQASEIRDKFPNGGEFTIRDLIRYALVESDGSASDVLLRVLGGPPVAQDYIQQIGINDMQIVNTEKELGANWDTQYQNLATPMAAVDLLRWLDSAVTALGPMPPEMRVGKNSLANVPVPVRSYWRLGDIRLLPGLISDSYTGRDRIRGLLPDRTLVAHKTGTGGTRNGITSATNDIGIIDLPNGKHLAIAVFVSDSPADDKTRDAVIARIAKAAYDKWSK
jgi:beta-lactamase class A